MNEHYNVTEFNTEEYEIIYKFHKLVSQICAKTKPTKYCHFCKLDFICNAENLERDIETLFF